MKYAIWAGAVILVNLVWQAHIGVLGHGSVLLSLITFPMCCVIDLLDPILDFIVFALATGTIAMLKITKAI